MKINDSASPLLPCVHVPDLDRKPIVRATTLDEDTFKPIGVQTRYIFVQLPFFNKEEEECKNLDDKWIYNIKNMGIRQEVAFKSNSEVFKRLAEVANVATLTPEQRYHYEADIKNARDTLNRSSERNHAKTQSPSASLREIKIYLKASRDT